MSKQVKPQNYWMQTTGSFGDRAQNNAVQMIMELPTPGDLFPAKMRKGDTIVINGGNPLRVKFIRRTVNKGAYGDTKKINLKLEVID